MSKSTYIRRSEISNDIKDKNNNKNEDVYGTRGGNVYKSTYIRTEKNSDIKNKNNKNEDAFGSAGGKIFNNTYVISGNRNNINDKNNKNENNTYSYSSSSYYSRGPGFKSYKSQKDKNI